VLARAIPPILLVAAAGYLSLALGLPMGTAARPGPGFYPVIVGIFAVIVLVSVTAIAFRGAASARTGGAAPAEGLEDGARRRVLISVVALGVFCLALPWVGYPVTAFAFVTAVLRSLGGGWTTALITGALASAGSYGLFAVLLDVPLPRGLW
jgi:putative tricarboxylic transport membrane protein